MPVIAIGSIMSLYWARVLRLAWKQKRRTGRAGNLFPAERVGRVVRVVWFPVIGLWIGLPLVAGLGRFAAAKRWWVLRPLFDEGVVAWGALLVGVVAFIATWICWRKMGRSWRMGIDPADKTRLIVSGPYAYLRHPIYSLSSLLMLCTMVILPSPAMIGVGVLHLGLLQWEARREERYLRGVHGESYVQYAAGTGGFLPRVWGEGRGMKAEGERL